MPLERTLSKETIDSIFANATHQSDYVYGLYKAVIPDWSSVIQFNGYPQVSNNTSSYMMRLAIDFDTKHHPNLVPGGALLNNGFSSTDMPDWIVRWSESDIERTYSTAALENILSLIHAKETTCPTTSELHHFISNLSLKHSIPIDTILEFLVDIKMA